MPHTYVKHLPYTTFVASARYFTDLFRVEFWKKQDSSATFDSVVKDMLRTHELSEQTRRALCYVARGVDRLEDELRLFPARRKTFGLGDCKPENLVSLQATLVRPYFLTLLLDRLLWANLPNPEESSVTLYKHPFHTTPPLPIHTRTEKDTPQKILRPSPQKLDSLIANFLNKRVISQMPFLNLENPPAGEKEIAFDDVVRITVGTSVLYASSDCWRILGNIYMLAASALFLIGVDTPNYIGRYIQSVKHVVQHDTLLQDVLQITGVSTADTTKNDGTSTQAITVALAGSPIFALDIELNLLRGTDLTSRYLRHQEKLAHVFAEPIASNNRRLAAEAAIWKAITLLIGEIPADPHNSKPLDVTLALAQLATDIQVGQELTLKEVVVQRETWPHTNGLRYQGAKSDELQAGSKRTLMIEGDEATKRPRIEPSHHSDDQITRLPSRPRVQTRGPVRTKPKTTQPLGSRELGLPGDDRNTTNTARPDAYKDCVKKTKTLPAFENVRLSSTEQQSHIDYTLKVSLSEAGCLSEQEHKYTVIWPAGMHDDRLMFQSMMQNSTPARQYNGIIPGFNGEWNTPHSPCEDIFPLEYVDAFLAADTPAEWRLLFHKLLADRPIQIASARRREIPASWKGRRDLSLRDLQETFLVNINVTRTAHKLAARSEDDHGAHLCSTTIQDVISSQIPAIYFHMPSPHLVSPPQFLRPIALDGLAGQVPMPALQYSTLATTRWNLLATCGALSRPHFDAGKFNTWAHVLRGANIWAVLDGPMPKEGLKAMDVSQHKWKYFVLEEDDILIMPPGTVHIVLTIQDALVEGGHFYSSHTLVKSLDAGLWESTHGASDTNMQVINGEAILHTLLQGYVEDMQLTCRENGTPAPVLYQEVLRCWPPLNQMAALLVMTGHASHFEPQRKNPEEPFVCTDELVKLREETASLIYEVMEFCPDLHDLVLEHENKIAKRVPNTFRSLVAPSSILHGSQSEEQSETSSVIDIDRDLATC